MSFDIEHMASEHSQQDWNRLEYASVCRKGYIQGAKDAIEHYGLKYTQPQAKRMHELLGRCKEFTELMHQVDVDTTITLSVSLHAVLEELLAELEKGE